MPGRPFQNVESRALRALTKMSVPASIYIKRLRTACWPIRYPVVFFVFFLSYHPLIHSSDTYWIQSNEGIFPRRKGKRKSNIKGEEPWNLLSFVLFGKIYWKEKPINKMSKNTWPIIEKSENKSSIYKKKQRIMWKMKHKVKKKMRKETIYKRKRENQPEDLGK